MRIRCSQRSKNGTKTTRITSTSQTPGVSISPWPWRTSRAAEGLKAMSWSTSMRYVTRHMQSWAPVVPGLANGGPPLAVSSIILISKKLCGLIPFAREGRSCRTFVLVNLQSTEQLWERSFFQPPPQAVKPQRTWRVSGEAVKQLKGLNKSDSSVQFENSVEGPAGCQGVEQRVQCFLISLWGKEWRAHLCLVSEDTPLDLNTFLTR